MLSITCLIAAVAVTAPAGWQADPELVEEWQERQPQAIFDESKVPEYTLPPVLEMEYGREVDSVEMWENERRPELLSLFERHVYGEAPEGPWPEPKIEVREQGEALGGAAVRKQVRLWPLPEHEDFFIDVLLYAPASPKQQPAPAFVGLNFWGNHTTTDDPAVLLGKVWRAGQEGRMGTDEERGERASRWPYEDIIKRGYAVATVHYGDIDPDFDDGFENGIHGILDDFPEGQRPKDAWGSIGAWAWGLSRIMDYLEEEPLVDDDRVAVIGHSRLGKTSLWAGAQDPRFWMVISNDSGCGGAALSRRRYGEPVKRINTNFLHWFCKQFHEYGDKESAMPVDQHQLIALIAPRPAYVASADEDLWADPKGEYLSLKHAQPAYELYGKGTQMPDYVPPVGEVTHGQVGHHIRAGGHDLTLEDWQHFMDLGDKHRGR